MSAIIQTIVQYSIQASQFMWPVFCPTVGIVLVLLLRSGSQKIQPIFLFSSDALYYYCISFAFTGCRLFTLDSVNLCRKYTFVFDLLLSMIVSSYWCVLSWRDFCLVQQAMAEHHSQMVWFRRLYIIFSRYMVINSLREMNVCDAELEIQIASMKSA